MFRRVHVFVLAVLWSATAVGAQPPAPTPPPLYTFTVVNLSHLVGLNDHGYLVGIDTGLGGLSYLVKPDETMEPIQCDPAVFPRSPTAFLGGPHIAGINNAITVVGDDEHVSGASYGIVHKATGECIAYLHPGSVATIFTGISNATDPVPFVVGVFWDPLNPAEPGLKRVHGFVMTNAGVLVLDGPGPDDRNFLSAWNAAGDVIGYGLRGIGPGNTYTYQAFLRYADGTFADLHGPDGVAVCPRAINDNGIVIFTVGTCEVEGSDAYWYDSVNKVSFLIPKPTAQTIAFTPTGLANDGSLVGHYLEAIPTGYPPPDDTRTVIHQFVAHPAGPTPNPKPLKHKKTHWKQHRHHLKGWWEHGPKQHQGAWWPAEDEEGEVVLTDGHRKVH
jgi:hypothetical protein